jgi:GNAT superfamily N-acetyltransferase
VATCEEIVRLEPAEYRRAATALARAFFDYNLMLYASPDAARRARGVAALYGAILADCFRLGEVHVTRDGVGAACWLPPGTGLPGLWRQTRSGMLQLPFCFGWASFNRLVAYDTVARTLHHEHASMPNWYLAAIGVEPERQGQGLGGALMQPILARADRDHLACYLETHREGNVRLYERHGFEVVCRAEVPDHPIAVWAMVRKPR